MKRRHLVQWMGAGLLASTGTLLVHRGPSQAQSSGLAIQWLGHSCFLFSGQGQRLLANPYKPIGCTAKYPPVKTAADLVMISSQLLDEGYVETLPGDPKLLFNAGIYRVSGLEIQGIETDHDRRGGRRFGKNLVWKWSQGGIKVLHLGGIAVPISLEQQILMGQPDVLFVPIGGGPKVYTPEEAVQAVRVLKPKVVIPTQFKTSAADPATCDLAPVSEFVQLMGDASIQRLSGNSVSLSASRLPSQTPTVYLFGSSS